MKDITGKTVDRLPILISQESGVQLLKVPHTDGGKGVTQADAILETLHDWNAVGNVCAMCFDTTPANTGRYNGACGLLETKMGRSLLKLGCRHHVYELMLKGAFEAKHFMPTDQPTMQILENFKEAWDGISHANYTPGIDDPYIKSRIPDTVRNEIIQFCNSQLKMKFKRTDYKELLQLTLTFLGANLETPAVFHKPGSTSTVRWMSRAL